MSTESPSPTSAPEHYTVITRGVTFNLSADQVGRSVYLMDAFGQLAESESMTIHLNRHPKLFQIIVDHSSGYDVLPLQQAALPESWTLEMGWRNLRRDAVYLGLHGLVSDMDLELATYDDQTVKDRFFWNDLNQYLRFCGVHPSRVEAALAILDRQGITSVQPLRNPVQVLSYGMLEK